MLPFQKTGFYKKSLTDINEVLQTFERKHNPILKQKIHEEALDLATNLAKALDNQSETIYASYIITSQERIVSLISLIDLARKSNELTEKESQNLLDRLDAIRKNLLSFKKDQKKILILSAYMGRGHMSAASALKQGIEHLYGYDYDVEIVDFLEVFNSVLNKMIQKSYEKSVKFTPNLYKFMFESWDKKWQMKLLNQINYPIVVNRLKKYFDEKNPHLLISTFPIWDYLAAEIWKRNDKSAKFISLVTDSISIHNTWVIADTDFHIVANEDTAHSLEKMGIERDKIKTLGFPVKLDFLKDVNKEKILRKLHLKPKKFTILFLPTSQTQRKINKIMNQLLQDNQYNIIVVTGRDPKLRPKFKKFTKEKNVKIIGWTDKIADLIKVADLVITKAGGATLMECIATKKPTIITSIIPGQEVGNAELIQRYHIGLIANETGVNICDKVEEIRKNYGQFEANIEKISNPRAALDIAEFIKETLENENEKELV